MKYYLIAGEASGDLHGSNLMKSLKGKDPQADFRIWGGDLMEAAGGTLVKHYRDLAFMGFVEVVQNLRTILGNIRFCKEDILAYQPDVLILIDYPGFNLRIARWAHERGIKVFYYISPQLWAWHSSRVKNIRKSVDRMFVILPFEQEFYAKYDMEVDFVGHPLLDVIEHYQPPIDFREKNGLLEAPIIALLPGSRKQEIQRMLSVMLQMVTEFPDYQFVIGGAPSMDRDFYENILHTFPGKDRVHLVENQTYPLLSYAQAALVTSGTATLETALFDVPQVVCYRGSTLSYLIARQLVNVSYISLVNLIADAPLVTELIQQDFNPRRLQKELADMLDPSKSAKIKTGYARLRETLGHAGASERIAELMVEYLEEEE